MSRNTSTLTLCYTAFLLLLILAGLTSGTVYYLLYFAAFILPLVFGLIMAWREERIGLKYLSIDSTGIKRAWPLVFPTVSVVIAISALTSFLIFLTTGRTNSVDLGSSFFVAILRYALLPALLEEMLFRYLPLRLLSPYSRRGAVLISAFFFSLVHHDLFSIPYAFIAGVIFMAVDIATDSVIPSLIIHFINNALSVGIIIFKDNAAFAPIIYVIIGILTLISLAVIYIRRGEYKKMLYFAFDKGEQLRLSAEMLAFALITISMAVISLI